MIDLTPVNSSNMHSAGHDGEAQHVRYHTVSCNRRKPGLGLPCNCAGGPVYRHAGVPAELHSMMMAAPSVAGFHASKIKGAKDPKTLAPLYPHQKIEEKVRS